VPVADMEKRNSRGLGFFWSGDGRSVGHTSTIADGEANPDKTLDIRFYDLSGRRLRTLGFTGVEAVRTTADVSPDGSRVVAVRAVGDRVRIVDLSTGEVTATFTASPVAAVAGWYDDEHLVLLGQGMLRVVDLRGRVVRTMPASEELLWSGTVHLVRAKGLPAASARYAF
jgi:hypothetical protein